MKEYRLMLDSGDDLKNVLCSVEVNNEEVAREIALEKAINYYGIDYVELVEE